MLLNIEEVYQIILGVNRQYLGCDVLATLFEQRDKKDLQEGHHQQVRHKKKRVYKQVELLVHL